MAAAPLMVYDPEKLIGPLKGLEWPSWPEAKPLSNLYWICITRERL